MRNISNCLSIRTAFDSCSEGLKEHARARGCWDGTGAFDFAAAFSEGDSPPLGKLNPGRETNGHRWVHGSGLESGVFSSSSMLRVLLVGAYLVSSRHYARTVRLCC